MLGCALHRGRSRPVDLVECHANIAHAVTTRAGQPPHNTTHVHDVRPGNGHSHSIPADRRSGEGLGQVRLTATRLRSSCDVSRETLARYRRRVPPLSAAGGGRVLRCPESRPGTSGSVTADVLRDGLRRPMLDPVGEGSAPSSSRGLRKRSVAVVRSVAASLSTSLRFARAVSARCARSTSGGRSSPSRHPALRGGGHVSRETSVPASARRRERPRLPSGQYRGTSHRRRQSVVRPRSRLRFASLEPSPLAALGRRAAGGRARAATRRLEAGACFT